MNKFDGTWLRIKDSDTYCDPEFVEFCNDQIIYFKLTEKAVNGVLTKEQNLVGKLSETKYEFVTENRIRIFRMGKTLTVISEAESISRETEFTTDYEKIVPTKTNLTAIEIQKLEFIAKWNGEKIPIVFNKNLDRPAIQEVNKRLNKEGQKLLLENLQGTYFVSIYVNGERNSLIGIREVDTEKAVLFGFPEKPYEVNAN